MGAGQRPAAPDAPPLWQLAGRSPSDPAVRDPRRGETWAELDERTNAVGHGVESLGLESGQHVALVAGDGVEFVDVVLGVQRAGMVVSPLKTSWTPAEIGVVLADAGTRLVATDTDNGRRAAAQAGIPVLDLGEGFDRWLAAQDRSPLPAERRGWRMSYTSGTTGRPKGVVHADSGQRPFSEAFARSAVWAQAAGLPADGAHLVASHLFHGAPLTFGLSALAGGAPLVVLGRWDPSWCLHRLGDGVTSTAMVPTMFRQLLALAAEERASFYAPALRTVLHGGEPCPPDLKARMVEWWGPVFVEYFGFSEGGMTLATTDEWERRPGTVGRALPHQEILVLDADGQPLPPRSEGLVYFRSLEGQRFRYHNDPAKTAGAYGPDGAFTAGDIGWLDEDGYLFISGRQADVIVSAGVNVYPAEIEAVISAVPAVADVAVVGGPDDERGEHAVAFVVLRPGADPDTVRAQIEAAGERALAGYKRPRDVVVRPSLPRDATGKLLRNPLRDELWEGRSSFAAPVPEAGTPSGP
jgi:acyl-CoA synthetase (AMP-forming)/AMP-acid ligase II